MFKDERANEFKSFSATNEFSDGMLPEVIASLERAFIVGGEAGLHAAREKLRAAAIPVVSHNFPRSKSEA